MSGPRAKFQITGLEDYIAQLKKVGANIDEVVAEAIQESAKPIEEDIRKWAEKHKRTGAVLDAAGITDVQREGNKFFVEVGILSDPFDNPTGWHAVFLEYGTPRMKADPGIYPAFKRNKSKVKRIQKEILQKGGIPID